jgi:hypothetical protein
MRDTRRALIEAAKCDDVFELRAFKAANGRDALLTVDDAQ